MVEREIENYNTAIIDAFYEGSLLCGDAVMLDRLRSTVLNMIRDFTRTKDEWIRIRQ